MTYDEMMDFVSDIKSSYNKDTFDMFYKYIPQVPKGRFVDFGTGYAKSVVAISKLNPNLEITTLDSAIPYNFDNYLGEIRNILDSHDCLNVASFLADSREFSWGEPLSGLNIDSEHSYEVTKQEIEKWVPFVIPGGYIFLDDYLVERCGVKQAVDEYFDDRFENLNPNGMCQVWRVK